MLTDREKLKVYRKSRIAWREKVDKGQLDYSMEEQQKAMGKWIAEYFDDAGYEARARAGRVAPPAAATLRFRPGRRRSAP